MFWHALRPVDQLCQLTILGTLEHCIGALLCEGEEKVIIIIFSCKVSKQLLANVSWVSVRVMEGELRVDCVSVSGWREATSGPRLSPRPQMSKVLVHRLRNLRYRALSCTTITIINDGN